MCSSASLSSSSGRRIGENCQNGTMLGLSCLSRRRRRCSLLFTLLFLFVSFVLGAGLTVAEDISSSTSSSLTEIAHHHETQDLYRNEPSSSFMTKIGNGFERLVVSIDDRLALLSQTSSQASALVTGLSSSASPSTTQSPHVQHECQTVLEQLKELLSRTSEYLFKATKGQTYFRQVSLLLPPTWANVNCTGVYQAAARLMFPAEEVVTAQNVATSAVYHAQTSADIYVTPDHPVYIDRPWTLQYGGCGTPGKKISIPLSFITTGVLGPQGDVKARLLVREWVKYRYGVFDENGFAFDEKYPLEYVGSLGKPVSTACHLNRTHCGHSDKCGTRGKTEFGHLPATPIFKTSSTTSSSAPLSTTSGENGDSLKTDPKLSLMSLPLDPQGHEFCDEHTHIRTTPTKHNFLCDGQSIWEVMRQHEDFRDYNEKRQSKSLEVTEQISSTTTKSIIGAPPPSFAFVTAKTSRVIFLLDRTQSMSLNNRWTNLRRSMYRMFHHVPAGVELGVISFTNVSTVSLPLTVTSAHNRDHLHGRVPVRPLTTLAEDACISCALRTSVKLLKTASESVHPATIVLISASSKLPTKEWEKMSKILEGHSIRVIVVSYDDSVKSSQFVELTGHGEMVKIADGELDYKQKNLEQSQVLNNIFLKVISEHLGSPLYKVHEKIQWPNSDWQVRGKFIVEESLGRNTWVTVTPEEHGDVDGLQLLSPTGKEFDLPLNAEGMTFLRIPGAAEPGTWTYTVKYYHNQAPRPISIDVVTEARKPEGISIRFWNRVQKQGKNQPEVALLFAQVLQGDLPVLNANVTATIKMPSGNHQTEHDFVRVRLLDTGSGDPDITWGDGIYSAYFTQLGPVPGVFGVNIQINDNNGQAVVPVHTNITRGTYDKPSCCGSTVPHIATIPTGSFNRHIIGAAFTIHNGIPLGEDPYPPGRVTDLRVERVVDSASEIKLSWTAPGGDFDKGKATKYEIRCYTSREALTNDQFSSQGILVHSSITPEPESYGVRQSCVVAVPWENDYFYYGIVAIDSALNRGKVSNLVSVYIKETATSTVKITDAWEDDALVSNLTSSRSLNLHNHNPKYHGVLNVGATWFRGLNEIQLYIILAGAAIVLILTSLLILAFVCMKRNKKTNTEGPPAYHNIYTDTGKGQNGVYAPAKKGDDALTAVGCCWENESTNSTSSKDNHEPKPYTATQNSCAKMSSYIPASALYPPVSSASTNLQYRDIYSGNNNDSSSVGSKPSDGGSDATHLTHDIPPNALQMPSYYPMGLNPSLSFDPLNTSVFSQHSTASPHHVFKKSSSGSSATGSSQSPSSEDDDEGGFKNKTDYNHQQNQGRVRDTGHYVDSSNFPRVSMPMPSTGTTVGSSECDKMSPYPNGSYGGSIMSMSNNHGGSQKKRTRHISFV